VRSSTRRRLPPCGTPLRRRARSRGLGGLGYASDESGWAANEPADPAHQLVVSFHNDAAGVSYLGWAWDATAGGWSCSGGPSLVVDYSGTPTAYGVGLKQHLAALAAG